MTNLRPMVQCMMCTSKDLGGLAQEWVPPLLLWCGNSLHNHHESPQNNVHVRQELADQDHILKRAKWKVYIPRLHDETLPGQWVGKRDNVEYPLHSLELTSLSFYLWGSLKDVVYCRKSLTLETLWEEIEMSCAAIPVDTLSMVACALVYQKKKCLQADGGHFEHLFRFNTCRSHLTFCVYQIWIINTLLMQIFCTLRCVYIFFGPSVVFQHLLGETQWNYKTQS
jgi:hypothetical protein